MARWEQSAWDNGAEEGIPEWLLHRGLLEPFLDFWDACALSPASATLLQTWSVDTSCRCFHTMQQMPYAVIRARAPREEPEADHLLIFVWRQWFRGVSAVRAPTHAAAQSLALSWCQPRTRQRLADGDTFVWLELRGAWINYERAFAEAGVRPHGALTLRIEASPWINLQGAQRIPRCEGSAAWTSELRSLAPGEDPRVLP